jgi:glycosyltransferase involved in cell wall biosynthesis
VLDVTCGIKTLMRPNVLRRLLTSIEQAYPDMKSVVVDDSPEPDSGMADGFPNVQYIYVGYDLGLGASRNIMIDAIDTKYTVYLDDDFYFFKNTRLEKFRDVLENSNIDLIAGAVTEHARIRSYHGLLQKKGETLVCTRSNRGTVEVAGLTCQLVDVTLNFFMARTDKLRTVKWDPELKINTHTEFFLRAKDAMKIAFTPEVVVGHRPATIPAYTALRKRPYRQRGLQKHGITRTRYVGKWG